MKMAQRFLALIITSLPLSVMATESCPPLLEFSARPLSGGAPVDFCAAYRGKVILAVNTASQCGYTGQLKGLESLYQTYRDRGLVVLGFPSNDFKQEFEKPAETEKVARQDYGVTFPLFERSAVTGNPANRFFQALSQQSGVSPAWNFQKYLVGRNGQVIKVYPANVGPEDALLTLEIEAALAAE
jgi:glutathione peroxidase